MNNYANLPNKLDRSLDHLIAAQRLLEDAVDVAENPIAAHALAETVAHLINLGIKQLVGEITAQDKIDLFDLTARSRTTSQGSPESKGHPFDIERHIATRLLKIGCEGEFLSQLPVDSLEFSVEPCRCHRPTT